VAYFSVRCRYSHREELRKSTKNFRIVGDRAEIRTAHLSNVEVFCSTRDGVSPYLIYVWDTKILNIRPIMFMTFKRKLG
jgi:hypothetical protein